MEQSDKKSFDDIISLVARLALFVVDELEPVSLAVLEANLEDLYEFLVAVERKAHIYEGERAPVE